MLWAPSLNISFSLYINFSLSEEALGPSIKYVYKIFRKTNISNLLIRTRMCAYRGVRDTSFLEDFAYILNGLPLYNNGTFTIFVENFAQIYSLLKSSRLFLKYAYNYFSKCFLTHFMSLVSFYGDSIPVRFNKVLELMLINFLKIFTFVGICLRIVFPKFSAQYLFRFPFLVRSRFLGLTGYFCFKGFLH